LTGGLLTFWLHSLLPHFPAIVIVMVAAADGIDGMRRYHQTSCVTTVRLHASLPSDFMAHPEGTVDVPRRHRGVVSSQLVLAWLLWRRGWCRWHVPWLNVIVGGSGDEAEVGG